MPCPFCEIQKENARVLAEKKFVYVMFSNPRLVPGHLLVIPKRHVEKLSELRDDERKELFDTAIELQEKILAKLASGCDIRQNCRPFLPQSRLKINHVHVHLIPRELEDEIYEKCYRAQSDIFRDLPEDERARVTDLLK